MILHLVLLNASRDYRFLTGRRGAAVRGARVSPGAGPARFCDGTSRSG